MLYTHNYYRTATMFRGGMISLIYERTLTLQDGACSESAAVTLMSTGESIQALNFQASTEGRLLTSEM